MATQDGCSSYKDKQPDIISDGQYSNLNLNQNYQRLDESLNRSKFVTNDDRKFQKKYGKKKAAMLFQLCFYYNKKVEK